MLGNLYCLILACLLVWMSWHRMTHGSETVRVRKASDARRAMEEVDGAISNLLLSIRTTRQGWLDSSHLNGLSRSGLEAKETQLLDETQRQVQGLRRLMNYTRRDVGQLSSRELGSLSATVSLIGELAHGHQLCVDSSRLRLEALQIAGRAFRLDNRPRLELVC